MPLCYRRTGAAGSAADTVGEHDDKGGKRANAKEGGKGSGSKRKVEKGKENVSFVLLCVWQWGMYSLICPVIAYN